MRRKGKSRENVSYYVGGNVEETRSATSPTMIAPPEKVLLSMARHLSRRPCLDEVSRDSSPISFTYLLQP